MATHTLTLTYKLWQLKASRLTWRAAIFKHAKFLC